MISAARFVRLGFVWLCVVSGLGAGAAHGSVAETLLEEVERIAAPGSPGGISVFGPDAEAVVVGSSGGQGEPVVAAASLNAGRIVAFGHTGYFASGALGEHDTAQLMDNALQWASGEQQPRVAVFGQQEMVQWLNGRDGFDAEAIDELDAATLEQAFDVLVIRGADLGPRERQRAVRRFLSAGGGLVMAETGWGWAQGQASGALFDEHGGNQLLKRAGLMWNQRFAGATDRGALAAGQVPDEMVHAGRALDALMEEHEGDAELSSGQREQAAHALGPVVQHLDRDDGHIMRRIRRLAEGEDLELRYPTDDRPLTLEHALQRILIQWEYRRNRERRPQALEAHPHAEHFPGAVDDDAPRVTRTVQIDTDQHGWRSTGLYAAPGEAIRVQVPQEAVDQGLTLHIGAHQASFWDRNWHRYPEIRISQALDSRTNVAANEFGGLVYIQVPADADVASFEARFANVVEAPVYRHGQTEVDAWRSEIRERGVPWAELVTDKLVLTVPSEEIRDLENPDELMDFWDQVMDACADLAMIDHERDRPQWYLSDVQLVAGYMHAGYPIMTHMDAPPRKVDLDLLRSDGEWGLFHEVGHNHQSSHWTFGGTVEVTVNLFTLYIYDKLLDMPTHEHPRMNSQGHRDAVADYLANPDFDRWRSSPFVALEMYIQLEQEFGWEAYKNVFQAYHDAPGNELPSNDAEKRDQWMVRFSKEVGHDLGPFFEAWDVPVSEQAREQVADLPVWLPEQMQ